MATKSIAWQTGSGVITLTYQGQGDGPITVQSDANDLTVARSQQITIETTNGSPVVAKTVTISQAAKPYPLGVWIQATDGSLISASDWATEGAGKTANGIAVITANHRFLIAKSQYSNKKIYNTKIECQGATAIRTTSEAIERFSGKIDTVPMVAQYGSGTTYAAGAASSYTFPDGSSGYLPSCGELNLAYQYKTEIAECLSACGGTGMGEGRYHTSTYYGVTQSNNNVSFWMVNWPNGQKYSSYGIDGGGYVRPFCEL